MIEEIISRFSTEQTNDSFKRINSDHPINIYLGYNALGHKTLAIIENGTYHNVESTKMIELKLIKRMEGKVQLEFSLLDDTFKGIFYHICEDLILSSMKIEKDNAIAFILKRWEAWILIFKNGKPKLLPSEVIQGLIGELIAINEVLTPRFSTSKAINAWEGPLGGPKDFIIDDTWYEVKSKKHGKDTVTIDSIEQLYSQQIGNLIVISFTKSNKESTTAINLNQMVVTIKNLLRDEPEPIFELMTKLSSIGYIYDEEYDEICFEYQDLKIFEVDQLFPRINRSDLPAAIKKVTYEISVSEIGEFECK